MIKNLEEPFLGRFDELPIDLRDFMEIHELNMLDATERLRELHAEGVRQRAEEEGVIVIRNEDDARAVIDAQALQRVNHALNGCEVSFG